MILKEHIRRIEQQIDDPRVGLPEEVFCFASSIVPMVNVDLLIRDDEGRILLSRRDDKFEGWVWHIPGGIVRFQEKLVHRINQVAQNEIGQFVYTSGVPLAVNEIMSDHRERGHFISFLYECKLVDEILFEEKDVWSDGDLKWFEHCPTDFIKCQKPIYGEYFRKKY